MAACCDGSSFASVARFAAAIAASVDPPGAASNFRPLAGYRRVTAFAASYTAVWTIASTRLAGGGPSLASTTISPALTFHSVTTSARAMDPLTTRWRPSAAHVLDTSSSRS